MVFGYTPPDMAVDKSIGLKTNIPYSYRNAITSRDLIAIYLDNSVSACLGMKLASHYER